MRLGHLADHVAWRSHKDRVDPQPLEVGVLEYSRQYIEYDYVKHGDSDALFCSLMCRTCLAKYMRVRVVKSGRVGRRAVCL